MTRSHDPCIGVVAHREKLAAGDATTLRTALGRAGMTTCWTDIDKGSAATKATKRLLAKGATHVIACGGDGTVRASAAALVGTDVPLSVVPAGTANLFCGAMGLPTEIDDIVDAVRDGEDRRIDVGTCNGQTFLIMAGTGLDAAMIGGADAAKPLLGRVAYLMSGARAAHSADRFPIRVKIDGKQLFRGEASCVLVANIGRVMGGIEAVPDTEPDDGVLNVAVVTAQGVPEWTGVLWRAVRGRQDASGLVHLGTGEHITVKLERKHRFELDGGSKGKADRLDVTIVPGGLAVRVPSALPLEPAVFRPSSRE